jgi:hypothetical protein
MASEGKVTGTFVVVFMVLVAGVLAMPARADAQDGQAAPRGGAEGSAKPRPGGRSRAVTIRFAEMDVDHDGVITRAEWQGTDEGFRQQDTNHDGVLSGEEVAPPPSAGAKGRRRDELIAQFTRADRDGDVRLRRVEWTSDLGSFDDADANHDGLVSRDEFIAAHRTPPATGEAATAPAGDLRRESPAFQAGFDRGMADGRQAGKEDRTVNGGKWDLEGQRELEQADAGYTANLGRRVDYQAGYRAGFRRAYTEGFGPR